MKETLAERNERYAREGRTVSGGDGDPKGKPGYRVITLTGDDSAKGQQLTDARGDGFELAFAFLASDGSICAILENYKGKG